MTGREAASERNAPTPTDALEEAVRAIGGHARARNLVRARHLADAVADGAELLAEGGRSRAAGIAHQIAGSAGTFGFPQASRLAAEIEHLILRGEVEPDQLETVRGHVQAILTDLKGEPTF